MTFSEMDENVAVSFGICVGPEYKSDWLINLIISIIDQNIPEYEIILVSNKPNVNELLDIINQKILIDRTWMQPNVIRVVESEGWLPQKKNLLAKIAKYDILCIVHDYYLFDENWYDGIKEAIATKRHYNDNWDLLNVFVQRLEDGERGPDWVVNPFYMKRFLDDPKNSDIEQELRQLYPTENHPMYVVGLSPHETRLKSIQYVSGGYIMCRKDVLSNVKFNEDLMPGQAEDIEWFERVKEAGYILSFNPFSHVYTQKPNKWKVFQLLPHHVERLKKYIDFGGFNAQITN